MSRGERPDLDELPAAVPSRSRWSRLPLVWVLPIVVVLAGAFVVIHEKLGQGIDVEIRFHNAEGLEANKTKIRYKEVDIGEVREIQVAEDRKDVIVTAEIRRNAKDYMVQDTQFWVVRPRVSAAGVTGLATLVSGEYIAVEVGKSSTRSDHFVGLEVPPVITSGLPGREFILHAEDLGSLSIGSAVYYRHISVGQVVGYTMDQGGTGVTIKIFIDAPYDSYVNGASRFWQASGVDMSITSDGVRLRTESLTSLLEGGIAFQSIPNTPTTPVATDTSFTLFADDARAMRPVETEIRSFVMYFQGSLRGLSSGAPVELHGINIGEVKSLDVEFDQHNGLLRYPVIVELYPQRIRGIAPRESKSPSASQRDDGSRRLFDNLVTHGMRAELKAGNLLTGQKIVALDIHRDAPSDRIAWNEKPVIFPTISNGLDDIQDSVGSIARKLDKVPFEQLAFKLTHAMDSLDQMLKDADQLLKSVNTDLAPQVSGTLAEAREAMRNAKQLLGQDAPLQNDLSTTLLQVSRAMKSMNSLVEYLQRHPESLLRGKPKDNP